VWGSRIHLEKRTTPHGSGSIHALFDDMVAIHGCNGEAIDGERLYELIQQYSASVT
jgi:hypothetical protein